MAKVVHFEIPFEDSERAATFYRDALGWEVGGSADLPYRVVAAGASGEPGADGALIARGEVHRTPVLVIGVASLDDALVAVEAAGGTVVHGRTEIPGVGSSAYVRDTEGNVIGLFEPVMGASASEP